MEYYSLNQVLKMLGLSTGTWKRRKDEILEFISLYWDYEIEQTANRSIKFVVIEKLDELPKFPNKTKEKIKQKKMLYYQFAIETLQVNNYQTGVSIGTLAQLTGVETPADLYAISTISRFIAPFLRELRETLPTKKVWVRKVPVDIKNLNCYEELSSDQIEWLVNSFKQMGRKELERSFQEIEEARNTYEIENNDTNKWKAKVKASIGNSFVESYMSVIEAFQSIYGFYPFKIEVIEDTSTLKDIELPKFVEYTNERIQQRKEERARLKQSKI